MGVLSCSRENCENIMCLCYRRSDYYGYICNECFQELVESGPITDIGFFMVSRKRPEMQEEAALARFDVEFPLRDDY